MKFNYAGLYRCWYNMLQRCGNPNNTRYSDYGGRGISVCERWRDRLYGLDNFIEDLGPLLPGKTLDRINPNGNYEPSNCRWATLTEQARNKRRRRVVMDGEREVHINEIVETTGLSLGCVRERFEKGWSFDRIISKDDYRKGNRGRTLAERKSSLKNKGGDIAL